MTLEPTTPQETDMSARDETSGQHQTSARALTVTQHGETCLLFELYLAHRRAHGSAETTLKQTRSHLKQALDYMQLPPWEWRESHVDDFLSHRVLKRNLSTGAQLNLIYTLRGFQNHLLNNLGLCNRLEQTFSCRPAAFITELNSIAFKRKGNTRKKNICPLTPEHCQRLIAEFDFRIGAELAESGKGYNPLRRDKVMTQLCLLTGLRVEELVNVRITDFLPDAAHPAFGDFAILRVIGKGAKSRAIRLFNPAIRGIMEWYLMHVRPYFLSSETSDPQLLFLSERGGALCQRQYRRSLGRSAAGAGLPMKVGPHLLRHTYGTRMGPIIGFDALQKQLGHKYLSTTLAYYYNPDPEEIGNEVVRGIEKLVTLLENSATERAP